MRKYILDSSLPMIGIVLLVFCYIGGTWLVQGAMEIEVNRIADDAQVKNAEIERDAIAALNR